MIAKLQNESNKLQYSWDRHPSDILDRYLVTNHEDPRINIQSILTRAFIIDHLWPNEFDDLISDELRFGSILCWMIQELRKDQDRYDLLEAISHADPVVPQYIRETYEWLETDDCPIGNYISDALLSTNPDRPEIFLSETALCTFEHFWSSLLHNRDVEQLSIIEFGSGSANDYRFFDSFGLARFIDYRGIDISRKNIENARRRYPSVVFSVGNIFDSGLSDDCADYVLVHDLFEHFSPKGLEISIAEVMRICKKEAWLHLFNATSAEDHRIEPFDQYYWNTLSIKRLAESIKRFASTVEFFAIQDILNAKYNYGQFYNPGAVTLIALK